MIEIGLLLYWIAGLLLGTIGPAARSIQREVDNARGTPFSNEIIGRQAPSASRPVSVFSVLRKLISWLPRKYKLKLH